MLTLKDRRPKMAALVALTTSADAAEQAARRRGRLEDARYYRGCGDAYRICVTRLASTPAGQIPNLVEAAEVYLGIRLPDSYVRGLQAAATGACAL